ncbi:MAG: hypothetical protein JRJ15_11205 [Deltaproteobacteria bacterium]|nr:hypothetical protein [Deltaproteobacteria bacterium]
MVIPISETTSIRTSSKDINRVPINIGPTSAGQTSPRVAEQVVSQSDEAYGALEVKKAGKEGYDQGRQAGLKGEVRKIEVKDGDLTINVYDRSGKLLRKIPPGYLPLGEQKFDITV